MAYITIRELLEAGVHFGHQTKRWNPKMKKYIFGARNGIYIIDLQQTVKLFKKAHDFIKGVTANGQDVLFVGTKKQASESIYEQAYYCFAHQNADHVPIYEGTPPFPQNPY